MDWEKLEYHRTAFSVSEKWLVDAELTPDELAYIVNKPAMGIYAEQEYNASWREADKRKYEMAKKRAAKAAEKDYQYLSASKSKKIEDF